MKKILLFAWAFCGLCYAEMTANILNVPQDTAKVHTLDEVVVTSVKETNSLRQLPGAVSVISPQMIRESRIEALKDLSSLAPNLYIPDYGARLTSAVYIRGVGARSSGQSVGVYVDNVPYSDKSMFDGELYDIRQMEVHRGPQGTLYGRNAMGGVVNIYTLSPLDYQGGRFSLSGATYGDIKAKASYYFTIAKNFGLSLGAYYHRSDGFFTNTYNNKKADALEAFGGRLKLAWQIAPALRATYTLSPDYVDQGGFPYGLYHKDSGKTDDVSIGDSSTYRRDMLSQSLHIEYRGRTFTLSSTTAHLHLDDDMKMDQDFSPRSLFTLNQLQKQTTFSEEIALKSLPGPAYQWSAGVYAFHNDFNTEGPVTFGQDGVKEILQSVFDNLKASNPKMPTLLVTNPSLLIPGSFVTPSWGAAVFHQSTYNNILTEGLSVTAGIRLDYEKQEMNYRSEAMMNLAMQMNPAAPPVAVPGIQPSVIDAGTSQAFKQLLPKASLKYEWAPGAFAYLSLAKGYKTGGYNVQMSADLMQTQMQYDLMKQFMPALAVEPESLEKTTSYKPELSWNYEGGLHLVAADKLTAELTLFYMDVSNMQLTRFVESGNGRIITNAGKAASYGAEVSLSARLSTTLSAGLNYGYTHAAFRDYVMERKEAGKIVALDCKGKFVPYIPTHTLHLNLRYNKLLQRSWFDQISASAQLGGAGKIYWTEANDISQPFYALLNARAGVRKGKVSLNLWARNLTDSDYAVFYFESLGQPYLQKGKPLQAGIEISLEL
ncbi:MAG: TonB-dependent receptor [Tannerellaceae bacterium]|jgi:outer membrane receptor protein involved in Fe transport|nr:TonB-dependent receptor [Tannerellaceae bacterium]